MVPDRSLRARLFKAVRNPKLAVEYLVTRAIVQPIRLLGEHKFDKYHNIVTGSRVKNARLGAADADSLRHATMYQAVPLKYLEVIFGCLGADPAQHFVDIGCGKGRACFFAASRFQRITGIDFSESLIAAANRNLDSFRNSHGAQLSFEVGDARHFQLPDERVVVYLYNPFDEHIFAEFLRLNLQHFRRHGSRIAYVNDVCAALLESTGFVTEFRDSRRKIGTYRLQSGA